MPLFFFPFRIFRSSAGADQERGTWFSGWFNWCPTSERLLEIAESKILESKSGFYTRQYKNIAEIPLS